jgi:hypothetical protein
VIATGEAMTVSPEAAIAPRARSTVSRAAAIATSTPFTTVRWSIDTALLSYSMEPNRAPV